MIIVINNASFLSHGLSAACKEMLELKMSFFLNVNVHCVSYSDKRC